MIKNSSYINHQKDTIEIKPLMSQVDKTSENKLVDFSAKTLPHKTFCTALCTNVHKCIRQLEFLP